MSQDELPDATVDELKACGLRFETPPATTFANFGIPLVDQLFDVSSLTYAHVVKKTLASGQCVFTTVGRAPGLTADHYQPLDTRPDCMIDKKLAALKNFWVLEGTVLALTTKEKKAMQNLRLYKIHFDGCIDDLGKQRLVRTLPMEDTPRPPDGSRLVFSVATGGPLNKPAYNFFRDDMQHDEGGVRENGPVKFFLPANAVWIKSKRETTHYFLTQARTRYRYAGLRSPLGGVA